jgi:hypothetical protein
MASGAGLGASKWRWRVRVAVPSGPGKQRKANSRPVQGNSPNDRIRRGPGCHRHRRVCVHFFPAAAWPRILGIPESSRSAFFRHPGIFRPDGDKSLGQGTASRWSGPAQATQRRDGRSTPDCPSFAMSSGRLFLDRVARQQSPSPLHRHTQINMHFPEVQAKGDISTLPARGHFYFAATSRIRRLASGRQELYSLSNYPSGGTGSI